METGCYVSPAIMCWQLPSTKLACNILVLQKRALADLSHNRAQQGHRGTAVRSRWRKTNQSSYIEGILYLGCL